MQQSKGALMGWQVGEEPEDMPGVRPRPHDSGGRGDHGGRGDRGGQRGGSRVGPGGRGRSVPFQTIKAWQQLGV